MAGRYKILDHLGAGGVGAVYKAYDTQLDRYVAIKRLLSRDEAERSDQVTSQLKKEAASLATMQHPNIVSIYDLAGDEEGMFIVMELLDGDNLADWLERNPMDLHDFREFATQCLEGILSAHQLNVLHRDLKPENIKTARLPGGRIQAKIVDFGLARMSYAARKQSEDQSGHVLGSIYYMAPEQFLRRPLDGRTDIYSLGCVFYQTISGRRPFEGQTVRDVMDAHLHHAVYDLKELCPHLPPPVCDWIMWMINVDQVYRPANAQAALDHLRALVEAGWFAQEAQQPAYTPPVSVPQQPAAPQARPSAKRATTGGIRTATGAQAPARATTSTARPVYRPSGAAPASQRPTAAHPLAGGLEGGAEIQDASEAVQEAVRPPRKSRAWLYVTGVVVIAGIAGAWVLLSKPKAPPPAPTELPGGLPIEPADLLAKGAIMHYRAGVKTENYPEPGGQPEEAQPAQFVLNWHDLEPKAGDTAFTTYEHRKDFCPKYSFGKPDGFKVKLGMLQFDFGDGMLAKVPKGRPELKDFPFGDPKSKTKGLSFIMLVHPRLEDKDMRLIQFRNQDDRADLSVRAYPTNEFHCIARTRGKDNKDIFKEGKLGGRSTKGFSLITVCWDGATNRITMAVRSQDGGHSVTTFEAPKDCQVLNEIHLSEYNRDPKVVIKPEDKFAGDIAELAVWPFPIDQDPRTLLDLKFAEFYLTKPGNRWPN